MRFRYADTNARQVSRRARIAEWMVAMLASVMSKADVGRGRCWAGRWAADRSRRRATPLAGGVMLPHLRRPAREGKDGPRTARGIMCTTQDGKGAAATSSHLIFLLRSAQSRAATAAHGTS